MALTRDHESGVAQQSLTRLECADSPFGLMPFGIAEANLRIRPPGSLRHPDTKGRSASCDFASQSSSLRSSGNPTPSARANFRATRKDTKNWLACFLSHSLFSDKTLIGNERLP
jgi:hypothetical protein